MEYSVEGSFVNQSREDIKVWAEVNELAEVHKPFIIWIHEVYINYRFVKHTKQLNHFLSI